ncbi:MAG: DNA-processing protein DprA [Campylobacterota bacterium]|nr:DNA-processing protein DprA [Campylobacterota bacterium]
MNLIKEKILELDSMKKYPKEIFYAGDVELLKRKKISIIGSRKPTKYSRIMAQNLASNASRAGVCIVSGGAMGIDAVSHIGAGSSNTISVLPCGINIRYPAVNKNLLNDIESNGLLLSQFPVDFKATPYSFVLRNEIVVALGDVLVVAEAELDSGSMRSIEFALKMGKDIFVFPQRLGESTATNELVKNNKAKVIYDIDEFISSLTGDNFIVKNIKVDDFLEFCKTNPTYEEALRKFPQRVFESELSGEINIVNSKVFVL